MACWSKEKYMIDQLKIFYYFMISDGECSEEEKKKFDAICRKMGVNKEEKKQLIEICETSLNSRAKDKSKKIISLIEEFLKKDGSFNMEDEWYRYCGGSLDMDYYQQEQVNTIWNLINLGYSDKEYSKPEKNIVKFLMERWNMDEALVFEMVDNQDTMLALEKKKAWLQTTSKSEEEIEAEMKKIEAVMKKLKKDIERTLEFSGRER